MKLIEMNIIKDEMVSPEEERKYYEKLVEMVGEKYQEERGFIMEAFATFFAKVYLNYNFQSILANANLDIGGLTSYLREKPYCVLLDIQYQCPLLTAKTIDSILKASKEKVIKLIKAFHHDFLFNIESVSEINNAWVCLSVEDIEALNKDPKRIEAYKEIYNLVVLGTKEMFKKD